MEVPVYLITMDKKYIWKYVNIYAICSALIFNYKYVNYIRIVLLGQTKN